MQANFPHFGAIPQAQYRVPKANDESDKREVTIYELEPGDEPVLDQLERRVKYKTLLPKDNGRNRKKNHYSTLASALQDARRILTQRQDPQAPYADTSVIYMAVADQKPCGLLIGNMPKLNQNHEITNTYRNKPPEQETELDRLVAWPLGPIQERLQGVGKVLLSHFYDFAVERSVPSIYIRSAMPKDSVAASFYEQMGCRRVQREPIPWQTPDGPVDVVIELYEPKSWIGSHPVIPMEIATDKAKQISEARKAEFHHQALPKESVPIESVVDFTRF